MGHEWPPEKTERVAGSTIYYWTISEANKRAAEGTAASQSRSQP